MNHGIDLHVGRYIVTSYRHGMIVISTADFTLDVALFGDEAAEFRAELDTARERHVPTVAFPTVEDLIDAICANYSEVMEPVPAR